MDKQLLDAKIPPKGHRESGVDVRQVPFGWDIGVTMRSLDDESHLARYEVLAWAWMEIAHRLAEIGADVDKMCATLRKRLNGPVGEEFDRHHQP